MFGALGLFAINQRRWHLLLANVAFLFGAILIGLSSAPLPYWLYGLAGSLTLATLIAEQFQRDTLQRRRRQVALRVLMATSWLIGIGIEIPYQFVPTVTMGDSPELFIIADSITAGVDDPHVTTWPKLIAKTHSIKVDDFSRVGATVASAYKQAERLPADGGIVLLEIGGNDVLGTTTAADFELNLERLLTRVCAPNRQVLMFELPLPPLSNDFGLIQRRLAARHRVPLIPKRVLISVLTGPDATIDSLHLTQAGHDHMAAIIGSVLDRAKRIPGERGA